MKISNDPFAEPQSGAGCGRHALNNLLGYQKFIIRSNNKKRINLQSFTDLSSKIDLRSLCYQFTERIIEKEIELEMDDHLQDIFECQDAENYDINTLTGALKLIGYTTNEFNGRYFKLNYRNIDNWKIIINISNYHWTCAKKQDNNYIYIDSIGSIGSIGPTYKIYDSFDKLISHINDDYRIIKCDFIGEIIDPIDRHINMNFRE